MFVSLRFRLKLSWCFCALRGCPNEKTLETYSDAEFAKINAKINNVGGAINERQETDKWDLRVL